jgi:hypothetical protein
LAAEGTGNLGPKPKLDSSKPAVKPQKLRLLASRRILTDHHSMPVRRRYSKLPHAVRFVGRRLKYQGTPPDEFVGRRVDVVGMKVSEVTVIAHR